jgi:hypothetical protein
MNIEEIINADSYPIFNSEDPRRRALIEQCRSNLATNQYCSIPKFVNAHALERMREEAERLQSAAFHNNSLRNCYLHQQIDPDLPGDHARNRQDRSSVRMLAYDQIPDGSPLKVFYHASCVRELVSKIVNEGELFDNEDPYQPANYVCYQNNDESSWHFDADNSFTMTLMIQAAHEGGDFEMSPNTRSDENQNYEHVIDVLSGRARETVVPVSREPGELCIFRGCNSLHRVSAVAGDRLRIMGVFVYEFTPGVVGDPKVNATIYGSRVAG